MKISIIIPIYNAQPYLKRCLASVLNQTYRNIEVILIDDCSTDDSYAIINDYANKDQRIKVFQNKKNSLPGFSRNRGIKLASGEYIWFVDADDWLEPQAIDSLVSIAGQNRNIDVLLIGYSEHYGKKKILKRIPNFKNDTENAFSYFLQMRKGFCSMAPIFFCSKKFLLSNRINFAEGVYFEDVSFATKVSYFAKNIRAIPLALYNYYRGNESSITQSCSKKKIRDLLKSYEDMKEFLEAEGVLQNYRDKLLTRFVVFGLSRGFKMYLMLPKRDQKDGFYKRELFSYKKSSLLLFKTLRSMMATTKSFESDEKRVIKAYKRNLGFLWWVKNAYAPLRLIDSINRKLRKMKTAI